MDHETGRLLAVLDELGLRDSTFVLFTSDNGPETLRRYRGAERSYGSPGPLRGMKLHLYEGGIRVPGIVRWPGRVPAGAESREAMCGTDVLPTLCGIAGVGVPGDRAIDGEDVAAVLEGRTAARKSPIYWQYDRAPGAPKVAMRQGGWKLLADADLGGFELYNLQEDPGETTDLSGREAVRVREMAGVMRDIHARVSQDRPDGPPAETRPVR